MDLFEKFKEARILIVGDVMLDRYWRGSISRISPEAPVPVVNLRETDIVAGGAANVAVNIAGLGAKPFLVGIVGDDEEAKLLPQILAKSEVSGDFLIPVPDRQTTVKTRVVAHQQHIVRLDRETASPINAEQEEVVWGLLEKIFDKIDLVVISDYAKGFLTQDLLSRLITFGKNNHKKVIIDPKGKDYAKYRGATLLTPNRREAVEACKLEETCANVIEKAGSILLSEVDTEALLITRGEEGMTLFQRDAAPYNLSAITKEVYDVTGAGDTVISTLAVALAAGADLRTAANLANIAAGVVIEHFGTTSIKLEALRKALKHAIAADGRL